MFFLHKKHLTQRTLYTQTAHISFYRPTFLHAETLSRAVFTQQKLFRIESFTDNKKSTAVLTDRRFLHTESSPHKSLTHRSFYSQHFFTYRRFYTDVFTQTQIAHRNLCTQHTFTHNQFLHREALLPLLEKVLITYLSCSPSKVNLVRCLFCKYCEMTWGHQSQIAPRWLQEEKEASWHRS
jgi:hypothetical protein